MVSPALSHAIMGSLSLSAKLILIIVPLTVAYEFIEKSNWFKKLLKALHFLLKPMGFSEEASVSMLVGIFLGIAYGSGILITQSEKKKLTPMDAILTAVFLSMCHAVIEDTLVFVAIGANGFYIIAFRLVIAVAMAYLFFKYLSPKFSKEKQC